MIAALLISALAAAPPARFRAQTEVVRLDVSVSRDGAPLSGLSADEFEVRDDGVVRPVTLVSRAEHDLHAVLVFDVSASTTGDRLDRLKEAAETFLRRLEARDRVTLVTFSHAVEHEAGPVAPEAAIDAVRLLEADGGTALSDALAAGVLLAPGAPGRPVVLVLTDGQDLLSWTSAEDVLETARAGEASVYVVNTDPFVPLVPMVDPLGLNRRYPRDRARVERARAPLELLVRLADETGGRMWQPGRGLTEVFLRVLAEVKNRYLLAFDREPDAPPGWHALEVKLRGRKGDVRTRKGYFVR